MDHAHAASSLLERLLAIAVAVGPVLAIATILLALGYRVAGNTKAAIGFPIGLFAALSAFVGFLWRPLIGAIKVAALKLPATAFIGAAIPEESIKFILLMTIVLRHHGIRPQRDVILAAAWVGLGFAALENFFYVISGKSWALVGAVRAITAVPIHVALGLIMGFYISLALTRHDGSRRLLLWVFALFIPITLHGLYDLSVERVAISAFYNLPLPYLWGAVLMCTLLAMWSFVRGTVARALVRLSRDAPPADIPHNIVRYANGVAIVLVVASILMVATAAAMIYEGRTAFVWLIALMLMPLAFAGLWMHGSGGAAEQTADVSPARTEGLKAVSSALAVSTDRLGFALRS